MNDNNTVHQLNEALNELLNAYDRLKSENETLKDTNEQLEKNLAVKTRENEDLEERIIALTNTTEHHTNEIDTMLGRIKNILGSNTTQKQEYEVETKTNEFITTEEEFESEIISITQSELGKNAQTTMNIDDEPIDEEKEEKREKDVDLDFSRVQSFINGLNK